MGETGANIWLHFELGRRPSQPAYPGKVDRESGCGFIGSNQPGNSVDPPNTEGFLLFTSEIHPDLIQAYTETEFRVMDGAPFTLQVGKVSSDLLLAHKSHGVECSAFLTACNPFSQELTSEANGVRQKALAKELVSRNLEFAAGIGQHPSNQWSGEPSYLVFGLSLEAAKTLGNRFEQNAIVWTGPEGMPQLILLR